MFGICDTTVKKMWRNMCFSWLVGVGSDWWAWLTSFDQKPVTSVFFLSQSLQDLFFHAVQNSHFWKSSDSTTWCSKHLWKWFLEGLWSVRIVFWKLYKSRMQSAKIKTNQILFYSSMLGAYMARSSLKFNMFHDAFL